MQLVGNFVSSHGCNVVEDELQNFNVTVVMLEKGGGELTLNLSPFSIE